MKNNVPHDERTINVLWLVDHLGFNGVMHGASMYYLNSIQDIDKNNYRIVLCVLRKSDHITDKFLGKNIDVRHLARGKFDPRTLIDILKLVNKEKIHLIHAHGYGSANFGRLIKIVKKIPVIVHSHDEDRNYPFHQKVADYLLRNSMDQAIAISEVVKESSIKKRRFKAGKIVILRNGIPLRAFDAVEESRAGVERKRLGIPPESKVIGTVARLREEKGVEYLIRAAVKITEAFPDSYFLIAGDGPLRKDLEDLAKDLGLSEKIIFAGFCGDVPTVLSIIDFMAVPSLAEGFGIAALEAMAMGKPIVATNVGGLTELIKDGETGILVPSKNSGLMADRIIHLMQNMQEAKRIGINAKEESKLYDNTLHVRKLEKIYADLVRSYSTQYKPADSFGPARGET